ncbi:Putative oxidoreductase [Acidilobus saccharovorans 345-15]|uniref:Putative oxidoreductase n=1 Tax=Acidilobus saccharovorans (strain DSM 16705 / JCM 18335 / VKM B-2471 / 345-15) TaxID=666510 RepID=D9Q2X0_ACIS3|nr:FAD-binding oxidoreductase [Acidilobus saccharovorans]ADL19658.1 Putative oxidoreductase [Acidilobus saccharovorans 345-15]
MYDYIVVGSGITGLATAYHIKLMSPDSSVIVIDKEDSVGAGDTSKSAAAFRAAFTNKVNLMLAKGSITFYERVQNEGFSLGMLRVGYLFAVDATSDSIVRQGVRAAESLGVDVDELQPEILSKTLLMRTEVSGSEESKIVGAGDIVRGYLFKYAGVLDAEKLVDYYYSKLRSMGVEFQLGVPVKEFVVSPAKPLGIEGEPFPWEEARVSGVRLEDGRVLEAKRKIIAAMGVWANDLLNPIGIDTYSRPKKRQIFVVKADTQELRSMLYAEGLNSEKVMPFTVLPKGAYIRPNPTESTFWIGMADELGRPFARDENPTAEERYYTYGILPVLSLYFPQLGLKYPEASWAGHYDISFDGLPVIYEPYSSGLVVVAGTSGSGIMKGDSIGRVAAALALDMDEVELGDGTSFKVSLLGLEGRGAERELLIL